MTVYICNMCVLSAETPVDKKKTEIEQLREDNRKLCARLDEREADLAQELERNMQLHAKNKADLAGELEVAIQLRAEITRMDQKMTELREGGALVVHGLDVATQLISALIAWLPEGQVLPDNVGGLKLQLDQVWEKLRSKL